MERGLLRLKMQAAFVHVHKYICRRELVQIYHNFRKVAIKLILKECQSKIVGWHKMIDTLEKAGIRTMDDGKAEFISVPAWSTKRLGQSLEKQHGH